MSSFRRKPSNIFRVVKWEPLYTVTATGIFLSCSGSQMPLFGAATMANFDMAAPRARILAGR
jgi:hypothetical protein